MSTNSEAVKRWRKNTKSKMLQSMGNSCQCCGYNSCYDALEFHHLDPSKKDFGFAKIMSKPKSWSKIASELKKCVLVCSNCHRELHNGIRQLPNTFCTFDDSFLDNNYKETNINKCGVCDIVIPESRKFCSKSCSAKSRKQTKFDWSNVDLKTMYETYPSILSIANELGCSDAAIHKRLKKLGLK